MYQLTPTVGISTCFHPAKAYDYSLLNNLRNGSDEMLCLQCFCVQQMYHLRLGTVLFSGLHSRDEPTHFLLCQPFVEFIRRAPRPSPSAKLALYFPILPCGAKGRIPEFIWHERLIQVLRNTATGALQRTNCLLGDDDPDRKDIFIDRNLVTKKRLDHAVVLQLRHSFQFDGSLST
jgi:hypothetical protein